MVDSLLEVMHQTEAVKWCNILKHILDDPFLEEHGLGFSGSSHQIGDPSNGSFLGLIELLSRWDPILQEHVQRVRECKKNGECLQGHYLPPGSQNEFISECSNLEKQHILLERRSLTYFVVIVDVTPDSSHTEQTTFLLRYVNLKDSGYEVQEGFFMFADCSNKCGEEIALLIMDTLDTMDTLKEYTIPLSNCRVQAYDNAANMVAKYNGTQAKILEQCSMAIFSPCGCDTFI